MASAHQPQQPQQQKPTNPFDGFDSYTGVAAPPPASFTGSTPMIHPQPGIAPTLNSPYQQPSAAPVASDNPFEMGSAQTMGGALVASSAPANPYDLTALTGSGMSVSMVQPQLQYPQQPYQQQLSLVGASNQVSQWAMAPPVPASVVNSVIPAYVAGNQLVSAPASDDPFGIFAPTSHPQLPQQPTPQQNLQQQVLDLHFSDTPIKPTQDSKNDSVMPDDDEKEGLALIDVELEEETSDNNLHEHKEEGEFNVGDDVKKEPKSPRKDKNADIAPPPPMPPGRGNAEYLAQNSVGMTSPLPLPSLVLHSGYVLSRISFRTVLMRKWKQTFWIQYGPTQMLFFRTFADYVDWLNNPYHTIKAREFLIKLRVDFVSDLKKKSVMGYQVTQIRRKPYGRNVMLHFKLERWMDYGPTIAAAFAARQEEMIESQNGRIREEDEGMNTTNDVSALRKIILGCMRNARDAALVATQSRATEPPEYKGRYAGDENSGGGDRVSENDAARGRGGLYHQAFSAESSARRRSEDPFVTKGKSSLVKKSVAEEEEKPKIEEKEASAAAVIPIVDLLG